MLFLKFDFAIFVLFCKRTKFSVTQSTPIVLSRIEKIGNHNNKKFHLFSYDKKFIPQNSKHPHGVIEQQEDDTMSLNSFFVI